LANFFRWFDEDRQNDANLRVLEETVRRKVGSAWNLDLPKNQKKGVEVSQLGQLQTRLKAYKTGNLTNLANFFRWFDQPRRIDDNLRVSEESERQKVGSGWNLGLPKNQAKGVEVSQPGQLQTLLKAYESRNLANSVELDQLYSTGIGTGAEGSFAGVAEESGSGTGAGASGDCWVMNKPMPASVCLNL